MPIGWYAACCAAASSDPEPHGRTIVFGRHTGWADATIEIYTADADDGSGLRRLTNNRTGGIWTSLVA